MTATAKNHYRPSLGKNPNWKGGRTITEHGYVLVKDKNNPMADSRGYVYEHRKVFAETIGRPLLKNEIVHHADGNKQNNAPTNLVLCEGNAEHHLNHRKNAKLRRPGESNPLVGCGCGCGAAFPKYDGSGRPRQFVSGHNMRGDTHGQN